jgi:hypothetical protein
MPCKGLKLGGINANLGHHDSLKVPNALQGIETKSIFSVVRADDSVFAHKTPSYDGKDELN